MKTALYRHFDSADRLLYVGISNHFARRLSQHQYKSAWFQQIARVSVQWLPTRDEALAAERRAVASERPMHNIRLVTPPTKPQQRWVAWGVLHLESGRFDGWYFDRSDAEDMLEFFRGEYPEDRFAMVARTEAQPAQTGRASLRPHESRLWATTQKVALA